MSSEQEFSARARNQDNAGVTPAELGFRIPAEWQTHSATQLHWPSNRETWPGERLDKVEKVYQEIIKILSTYEPVILLVNPPALKRAEEKLNEAGLGSEANNVHVVPQPINDIWARDCGPVFISRVYQNAREYAITDWEYNAWGEKYPPFDADNRIPLFFAETYNIPRYETGIVLEGGSIETNGEGILLTTESVLLNENRNPNLGKDGIEKVLKKYLGIEKIIWLRKGLAGDDTDGHIDDLSRFLDKGTILTVLPEDPDDINYRALKENFEILKNASDLSENSFDIEILPLPQTKIEGTTVDGSGHVPASYANFYIANGVVLVPLYNSTHDDKALELFKRYFPERDVIGILCNDLVWGQGSLHCITQQLYGFNFIPP